MDRLLKPIVKRYHWRRYSKDGGDIRSELYFIFEDGTWRFYYFDWSDYCLVVNDNDRDDIICRFDEYINAEYCINNNMTEDEVDAYITYKCCDIFKDKKTGLVILPEYVYFRVGTSYYNE